VSSSSSSQGRNATSEKKFTALEVAGSDRSGDGGGKTIFQKKKFHPLGEVHLRIFAWVCMVLSQIGTAMYLAGLVRKELGVDEVSSSEEDTPLMSAGLIFSFFQYCFMPLILIANISAILRSRNSYFKSMLRYGGITLGIFIVYIYVYFHFIIPLIRKIFSLTLEDACTVADFFLSFVFSTLRQLNMFVDLLICTLIAFFTLYTPKKCFKGKWIYLFRSFTAIPLIWSLLGYIFLGLNEKGAMIPAYLFPFIPLKPPACLVAFISIVVYLKISEMRFYKNGGTEEEYDKQFLEPESIHKFSRFIAKSLAIGSAVDFIFLIIYIFTEDSEALIRIGFGEGILMFIIIPVVLFYDFTKGNNNPMLGLIIPIIGCVATAIVWIETIYWIISFITDKVVESIALNAARLLAEEESVNSSSLEPSPSIF